MGHDVNRKKKTARRQSRKAAWKALAMTVCLVMALTGWLAFGLQSASAMSCYIDAEPEQAEVGQDVTVTVVFSGDNVGRVRATLEYDKSILSYQGEEGDSGEVSLYMASSGDGIYYSLPFKAVGEGSCPLTMTPLDAYDMDEMDIALPEAQGMSVTVKAAETAPAPTSTDNKDAEKSDSSSADVKPDTQKDTTAKDKSDATLTEQPEEEADTNITIYILIGLAAVLAVILIIVLVHRARRREKD